MVDAISSQYVPEHCGPSQKYALADAMPSQK